MLVGRDAESAAIRRLLADARAGRSGALVIRGEPGIGKSALIEHACISADGFVVLRAAGVETESELAFAGLHQLLRPVLDRIDRLPEPQADALRAAFAVTDDVVDDRFRVSVGVLGLISEVAEEKPLLCLVDDVQWLDQASVEALVFAARRLDAERAALLLAARDEPHRAYTAPGLPELRPAALTTEDARSLVVARFGTAIDHQVVDWVTTNAAGNPLALVELPGALTKRQLEGDDPLDAVSPSTSVEQSYLSRVDRLPMATRSLLLVAACEESGERETIARAATELGLAFDQLSAAEADGLISVDATRVEFRHPLVRSAVHRTAPFVERERVHLALASVLASPKDADRNAWHRAAATTGVDDALAAELERTAARARTRGGPGAASVALERAAALSSDDQERGRRLALAAHAAWQAGKPDRAITLVARAMPLVTDPALKAELDHLVGLVEFRCGSFARAAATLFDGARAVSSLDPARARAMLLDAGSVAAKLGDVQRLGEVVHAASALPRSGDEIDALRIDLLVGMGGVIGGLPENVPPLVEAMARAERYDDPALLSWAAMSAVVVGDEATELAHLRHAVAVARESGAIDVLVVVLETVVNAAMLAGRYEVELEAAEGLTLARDAGLTNPATAHLAALAFMAGLRGRADDCEGFATEALESARANDVADAYTAAQWALGLLDLSLGRPDDAATRLAALRAAPSGLAHPLLLLTSTPDLVEAQVRAGRLSEAAESLEPLERFARPDAPAWIRALAARCRGLVEQGADAVRCLVEALELYGDSGRRFDRARTELLYGELLRRERRRADARVPLRSALEQFERMRAEPWAERARTELRATGERARKRNPGAWAELTPQELQIAKLVSEGNSNRDVALQLFLSPRTVEYHLRKVFAKLGLASRAELIRSGVPGSDD